LNSIEQNRTELKDSFESKWVEAPAPFPFCIRQKATIVAISSICVTLGDRDVLQLPRITEKT